MIVPKTDKKNVIAQWAYDTRPVLGRFHLWLEDLETEWLRGEYAPDWSFVPNGLERSLIMTAAVTALGTRLFGRFGEGVGLEKGKINQVKKDADALSAYAMSEGLWYLSRNMPENHAIMVCLGEGLMPKAGETPEMGSNPLLGFGRVYARPEVAKFLDLRVQWLINDPDYRWEDFYRQVQQAGITIWGAAIDTLENTSRFATGGETGPMTVLHLFDQPLAITRPYEGYMGGIFLPRKVAEKAEDQSVFLSYLAPRIKVVEMIEATYPGIRRENIHVWTLQGQTRKPRLECLWSQWRTLGVHLVDDGWKLPSGHPVFTSSGTYAPTYQVGDWTDEQGETHVFLCDGYAASAEAVQAASLGPTLDVHASLAIFSSKFELPADQENRVMRLDPEAPDLGAQMDRLFCCPLRPYKVEDYQHILREAKLANLPLEPRTVTADDFFPQKKWRLMAISGFMQPDPYSGAAGVEKLSDDTYRVTVRATTRRGDVMVHSTLRFMEQTEEKRRLVFSPLLDRFMAGREDYRTRPIKVSDSGRIRNELQTLISQALDHFGDRGIRVHFDRIPPVMLSEGRREKLREILEWYKENHQIWFEWLELV